MAVRETTILLDFITDINPIQDVNNQINSTVLATRRAARAYEGLNDESRRMMNEMNRGWRNQNAAFLQFRNDLVAAEYEYHNLARGTAFFGDETDELIRAITEVGAAHRAATNGMMDNNDSMRRSFYRTIGTFANMTPQAQRNSDAIARMNNPLYNVNQGALRVLTNLGRMANNANTARAALELLGPTASMRELREEQMRLNRGLGAMIPVAIGAAVVGGLLYYFLHKAAMGNEEYAATWTNMLKKLREAFQPMVDVFILVAGALFKFITFIAELAIAFNNAFPTMAKIIQGAMMLVPILTLLLLPLGLGVGLLKGYALAFGYFFRMIQPIAVFLGTMSATVWVVAFAIVALGAAFIWAWNNVAWFRDGIIAAWTWIKEQTMLAFEAIKMAVMPAIAAIVAFGQEKLNEFKVFWAENGAAIVAVVVMFFNLIKNHVQMMMGILKGIFQIFMPQITAIIKIAWALIQSIISFAMNYVMGIIKAVLALIRGDWQGAWDAIKGIFTDTWEDIKGFLGDINLEEIGKDIIRGLIKGISSMIGAVKDSITGIVDSIKGAITGKNGLDIHSPSRVMHSYGIDTWRGYNLGQAEEMKNVQAVTRQVANVPTEYVSSGGTGTSTTNNSNKSVVFSPVITVGNGNDSTNVKEAVQEAIDEAFGHFVTVFGTDGVI